MSQAFEHTLRSLRSDDARRPSAGIALAAAVLGGWIVWFFAGRVAVYEISDSARLEVEAAAHPVAARLDGQIVETRLEIGRAVRAGEILVRLDSSSEELALDEGRERAADLQARIEAIRGELAAEEEAAAARGKRAGLAIEESRARTREAEERARFAEDQVKRFESLQNDRLVSQEDLGRARAEAAASRAGVDALRLSTSRLEQDHVVQESDDRARLAKLRREAVELEGLLAVEEASNRRLEREIELRRIRSPIDGRIGESAGLRAGAVVRTGEELAAVIPAGKPRAVALFPVASVGRIRSGQRARLRMDGFPWTRYGTLAARVQSVASEPRNGRVRVELSLADNTGSEIPLEHGISGTAEVEAERSSPAALVLRAAGELLSPRPAAVQGSGPEVE